MNKILSEYYKMQLWEFFFMKYTTIGVCNRVPRLFSPLGMHQMQNQSPHIIFPGSASPLEAGYATKL